MTGAQYLLNRIAELEGAVATLLDQKDAQGKRIAAAEAILTPKQRERLVQKGEG